MSLYCAKEAFHLSYEMRYLEKLGESSMLRVIATFGVFSATTATSAILKEQQRRQQQEIENKISTIVPHPLPNQEIANFVVKQKNFKKIGEKPAGTLSGAIVQWDPSPKTSEEAVTPQADKPSISA